MPRTENFGDLIAADHEVLSEGCESRHNHRYDVVAQDLATQWIQSYLCKTKTSQETEKNLQKFLEPTRKPKVICTDLVNIYRGIIVRRHLTDRKQMGLLRERKGLLQYCCNRVWVKHGGRIPWNVIAICETYKISCLMGRHLMRGDSDNNFKNRLFHMVQWSNITLFLLKTYRDSINLVQ